MSRSLPTAVLVAGAVLSVGLASAQPAEPPAGAPKAFPAPANTPKDFFDTATKSLLKKPVPFAPPRFQVVAQPLTAAMDPAELRTYLQAGDAAAFPQLVGADALTQEARNRLMNMVNDRSLKSVRLLKINPTMLNIAGLPAADGPERLCDFPAPYCGVMLTGGWQRRDPSYEQMILRFQDPETRKSSGQAVLVRDESGVFGAIKTRDGTAIMRDLGPDFFAITESRGVEGGPSKDDVHVLPKKAAPAKTVDVGPADCPNPPQREIVEVVVRWTAKAEALALQAYRGMRQLLRTAEGMANTSFINSDINGRIKVIPAGVSKYVEKSSFKADVDALLDKNAPVQDLRESRRTTKADIAVLIVDNPDPRSCGRAAGIAVSKENAYAVVNWRCITDMLSFIHEIGHLVGAYHDPKAMDMTTCDVDPSYACGYVTSGKPPMATIMAYFESCTPLCPREWYWSNPNTKTEDGQVLGTAKHNYDACIWRKRLPEVAKFDGG